jgi:hypothetical protein
MNQGRLNDAFAEMKQDMNDMLAIGVDFEDVARGMGDEYLALMQDAIESGVSISDEWQTIGNMMSMNSDTVREFSGTLIEMAAEAQAAGREMPDAMTALYQALTNNQDALRDNVDGISAMIEAAVSGGQAIPAAMQPAIQEFIRMGLVSDDLARQMLGIADDGVPSLQAVTDAAGRYGIQLDALGPQVQGLRINEAAAAISADWETLVAAGADVNTILGLIPGTMGELTTQAGGMGAQIQDMVNRALQFGQEIPASMRPMIEAMAEAGVLTDATGNKLTNVGGLPWAEDLTQQFDRLIEALFGFTEQISNVATQGTQAFGQVNQSAVQVEETMVRSTERMGRFRESSGEAAQQMVQQFTSASGRVRKSLEDDFGAASQVIQDDLEMSGLGLLPLPGDAEEVTRRVMLTFEEASQGIQDQLALSGLGLLPLPDDAVDIADQLEDIFNNMDLSAAPPWSDWQMPSIPGVPREDGSIPMPRERNPRMPVPEFATGTGGQYRDFGAGTLVRLHRRERVMTEGESADNGATVAELKALRRDFGTLKRELRRAVRDSVLLSR